MENETSLAIERVFNLGDYKSFRVRVSPSNLTEEEKELVMLMNIFDAHKQFLLNQLIEAKYRGEEESACRWQKLLDCLETVKAQYITKEE